MSIITESDISEEEKRQNEQRLNRKIVLKNQKARSNQIAKINKNKKYINYISESSIGLNDCI